MIKPYIVILNLVIRLSWSVHLNRVIDVFVINVQRECKIVFLLLKVKFLERSPHQLSWNSVSSLFKTYSGNKSNCSWLKSKERFSFYTKLMHGRRLIMLLVIVTILWKLPNLNFSWALSTSSCFPIVKCANPVH